MHQNKLPSVPTLTSTANETLTKKKTTTTNWLQDSQCPISLQGRILSMASTQHQGNGQLAEMTEPPAAPPDEEADVGIDHLAHMPPVLAGRSVMNVPAHGTIKGKTYNLSEGDKVWVHVQAAVFTAASEHPERHFSLVTADIYLLSYSNWRHRAKVPPPPPHLVSGFANIQW